MFIFHYLGAVALSFRLDVCIYAQKAVLLHRIRNITDITAYETRVITQV